jgi:hypothetical protein
MAPNEAHAAASLKKLILQTLVFKVYARPRWPCKAQFLRFLKVWSVAHAMSSQESAAEQPTTSKHVPM